MKKIFCIIAIILTFSFVLTSCNLPFGKETETGATTPQGTTPEVPAETSTAVSEETTETPEVPAETSTAVSGETTETPEEPLNSSQGLAYTVNDDGKTCTITGIGTCADTNLFIGGYIDGYKVTAIGDKAFKNCSNFTSVTIGDSVITIGAWTFSYCSNFTSITIPNSVTSIGSGAFARSEKLTSVYIYDIDAWCNISFDGSHANPLCMAVKFYLIKDGSPELITNLVIPNSVTTIGEYAFYCCSGLTSVTIPDSVTTIGKYAFADCYKLTSVTIGGSVITIGDSAFYKCPNLTSFTVVENNKAYQSINGNLYSKDGTVLVAYACGKTDTSFVVPNTVTTIGDSAFYDCDGLTSVTIPDAVTTIGNYAFYDCDGLTSVTIPDAVTTIGDHAFYDCYKLTSVTIGESVTTIGKYAFSSCYDLTSALFANPNGWWSAEDPTATSGSAIPGSDLSNPSTAAWYLRLGRSDAYWHRTE